MKAAYDCGVNFFDTAEVRVDFFFFSLMAFRWFFFFFLIWLPYLMRRP